MEVTQQSLEAIVKEVAPKVEELTAWDTHLESLTLKIFTRKQYRSYTFRGIKRSFKQRLHEYAYTSAHPMGVYFHNKMMVILPENESFNEGGLKIVAAHELTHHSQYEKWPLLFEKSDSLRARLNDLLVAWDRGVEKDKKQLGADINDLSGKVYQYKRLLEGHATFVEKQLEKQYYPDAQRFPTPPLLFLAIEPFIRFITKRTYLGIPSYYDDTWIEKIYKTEGSKGIDAIYRQFLEL